jgi:hypothetical protein
MSEDRPAKPEPRRNFIPFPEQDENGVDLTLIRANLRLTPSQRLRRGDRASRNVMRLHEPGRRNRVKQA